MLKRGFAEDEVAGSVRILGGEVLHPQVGELLAGYLVLAAGHAPEGLLALLRLQAVAGADEREFPDVDAAIVRSVLQIKHEIHVLVLPVHHGAGVLGVRIPHDAPFLHRNLSAAIMQFWQKNNGKTRKTLID